MTLCSTVLAMGMMPLNMLLYGNYVDTGDIVVPYSKMAMSLVFISLPAGLGMLFNWFCPRAAPYITKLSSTLGGLLIVVTQIMEVFIFPDIFHNIPPVLYAATVVMPAAGMMLGYLISWLLKRPDAVRKTIAIESGIQNVGMGLTIVSLSFQFQDRNNDGSECPAFAEERRAAGGNPLRGRSRQRAPTGKKPRAKNNHAIGPGEATRTLHQQRRQGLTTRAGRHFRRRRGSKRHRLKW
ncbi:hypothetical protein HPB50_004099 [Hyalomma asiaticum]|uniref:Uncharacterized protein n=1 Tax=Hyalomma asiaticum TaxID=266040 RepID=A0ACB7TEA8_HYAAI|nr:hypothetical protein HPB50_004099 [Hyalomma asiaticum]